MSDEEPAEFFRFHNVPPKLQKKIRAYMEFSFSVTFPVRGEHLTLVLGGWGGVAVAATS